MKCNTLLMRPVLLFTLLVTLPLATIENQALAADAIINDDGGVARQEYPAIAISRFNIVTACWQDSRTGKSCIYGQRFGQRGLATGQNFKVAPFNAAAEQYRPDIALNDLGHFVVVWEEKSDSVNVYARVYLANFTPCSPIIRVNEKGNIASSTMNPAVAMFGDGSFVVVWKNRYSDPTGDIAAQVITQSGAKIRGNFCPHSNTLGPQDHPDIAIQPQGNFVLVWEDGRDVHQASHEYQIYARVYDFTAMPVGDDFKVSNHPGGSPMPYHPAVAIQTNGNFFISWSYGAPASIYGHLYNSSGQTLKSDYVLSMLGGFEPVGDNLNPKVCTNPALGYSLIWDSDRGGGSEIYLKNFDAAGTQVGNYTKLNETAGNQTFGDVAISSLGLLVCVWMDDRNGNQDIYGTWRGLQVPGNVVAGDGFRHQVPLTWDHPYAKDRINRYKIWRSLGITSPIVLLTTVDLSTRGPLGLSMRDYIDETALPGQSYLYRIEAEDPDSQGPSYWVTATANDSGHILRSKWAETTPDIDGRINQAEWSDAFSVDISTPFAPQPVILFVKNSESHLYVAVDDANDRIVDPGNVFQMAFDLNHDGQWDPTNLKKEGVIAIKDAGNSITYMWGTYPDHLGADIEAASGIIKNLSIASGHVQYEVSFDLAASPLRSKAGSVIGASLAVTDPGNHYFDHYGQAGEWPYGYIWEAAESMGDLVLASYTPPDTTVQPEAILVTNTNNSGPGSLRQALLVANTHAGKDLIHFNIPTTDPGYDAVAGVWTIHPLEPSLALTDDETVIDGATQKKFHSLSTPHPLVVLQGSGSILIGFGITGSHNTLTDLAISGFTSEQLYISGHNNQILACYIGTDAAGMQTISPVGMGIYITSGDANEIGGALPNSGNVIAGLPEPAIFLQHGATNNILRNNRIGINGTGSDTLGNGGGINIDFDSHANIVGPGNIISGNHGFGVAISGSDSNIVIGNLIGLDSTGELDWGNEATGVNLAQGASHNLIGGLTPQERNIISGNSDGILLYSADTDSNTIINNYIGTNRTGTSPVPNKRSGIMLLQSSFNIIGGASPASGNIISGNGGHGIYLTDSGCRANQISGNLIGLCADAITPMGNGINGIYATAAASRNRIGPGNTIAFNAGTGVSIINSNTIENTITQNSIFANETGGISLIFSNQGIEPPQIDAINPVTGRAPAHASVELFTGPDAQGKTFLAAVTADNAGSFSWSGDFNGDYITATATDAAGNTSMFSQPFLTRNVFVVTNTADSGPGSLRQAIIDAEEHPAADTVVFQIPFSDAGYDATLGVWILKLVNDIIINRDQIAIEGGSQATFIGQNTNPLGPEIVLDGLQCVDTNGLKLNGDGHHISGLVVHNFSGIQINIAGSDNTISGCYIGTDATGRQRTSQSGNGIGSYGGSRNLIGGPNAEDRNVISGLRSSGIFLYSHATHNIIQGNYIGIDASGADSLGNGGEGLDLGSGSHANTLGPGNVISGNNIGISFEYAGTDSNRVIGNLIGTDAAGARALGNSQYGVYLYKASHNQIGGPNENERNTISGNSVGIMIEGSEASMNSIKGNYIGTDVTGSNPLSNPESGIRIENSAKDQIIGPDNLIAYSAYGVIIRDYNTMRNTIHRNLIYGHEVKGIWLTNNSNGNLAAPVLTGYPPLSGTASANAAVEIFSGWDGGARQYEATVMADASGQFTWTGTPAGKNIIATATDASGNTSELSTALFTQVAYEPETTPLCFALHANFPNPFNPQTTIVYDLPRSVHVLLTLFDVRGQIIRILADRFHEAGQFKSVWDGTDQNGHRVASGVYFYRIEMGSDKIDESTFVATKKMLLIK